MAVSGAAFCGQVASLRLTGRLQCLLAPSSLAYEVDVADPQVASLSDLYVLARRCPGQLATGHHGRASVRDLVAAAQAGSSGVLYVLLPLSDRHE